MSVAGARSNRGDAYQNLIAFDWVIRLINDSNYSWLEVDSVNHDVDDIVIGQSDGSQICCQCKKNQTDFRAWSISDLKDELIKAYTELQRNPNNKIHFFSRDSFGDVAKIREFSQVFSSDEEFQNNLTQEHKKTFQKLNDCFKDQTQTISIYQLLNSIVFEVTADYSTLEDNLHDKLRNAVTNSEAAFNALWLKIDKLGSRIPSKQLSASTQHRLTKADILEVLSNTGAIPAQTFAIDKTLKIFKNLSVIGRQWKRNIAEHRLPTPATANILEAIKNKKRSILVTGLPGSGKTCTLLNLLDELESHNESCVLFIQSREFADSKTTAEREALGLEENWVTQAARLADHKYLIVVIDSLDVLAIAREHQALSYFLAQIDQLLQIPNLTLVTACREFDRKYDQRLAVREWDMEIQCPVLKWEEDIQPLLKKINIDTENIDQKTQQLISNPRELSLFVDLATHNGSANFISSQALAQKYLRVLVQSDPLLGSSAMKAIEGMAEDMLKSRSLSVAEQRCSANEEIKRKLLSLNILQYTHEHQLTFGHQTLLDVLVISGAIRQGVTLYQFIQNLPPVPFVRPSIRGFVDQLVTQDRVTFRKQIRTLLTSNTAFHFRRLVAESYATKDVQADDWPLILDLKNHHREVFQVIYWSANSISWHHFWLTYLVPELKETQDSDGILAHTNRIQLWKNDDPQGVLTFWEEALNLNFADIQEISARLFYSTSDFKDETLSIVGNFLKKLIKYKKPDHCFLGKTIARCVKQGVLDDQFLWQYITGDLKQEDLLEYKWDEKLHCKPHEFGDENECFLKNRMIESEPLLELAITSIEDWHHKRVGDEKNRIFYNSFIHDTPYKHIHNEGLNHVDNSFILFNAIEKAIIHHANNDSSWWENNKNRLASSTEGSLGYFAILALTQNPTNNVELIGQVINSKDRLSSSLSYELSLLIKSAFIYLDKPTQLSILSIIEGLRNGDDSEEDDWVIKKCCEYIISVPPHLRSECTQNILTKYEKKFGVFELEPYMYLRSGFVSAPFSYQVFIDISNQSVIQLLQHYENYQRDELDWREHTGGSEEVGRQLREASSRAPLKFLDLLITHFQIIHKIFKSEIMDGVTDYILCTWGNRQPDKEWQAIQEPKQDILVGKILIELEKNCSYWHLSRSEAKAIEACAYIIEDTHHINCLSSLAQDYANLDEEGVTFGGSFGLIGEGINMNSGNVADALMLLACRLEDKDIILPAVLTSALHAICYHNHPAVRALVLRRLPHLQYKNPEFGWELFNLVMKNDSGLWQAAESCLYYAYQDDFDIVSPLLDKAYQEGSDETMETWGRISCLSVMTGHIDFNEFISQLQQSNSQDAWSGASGVWTNIGNYQQHQSQCISGLEALLNMGTQYNDVYAKNFSHLFSDKTPAIQIPVKLIEAFLNC